MPMEGFSSLGGVNAKMGNGLMARLDLHSCTMHDTRFDLMVFSRDPVPSYRCLSNLSHLNPTLEE